ncbi:uncharacterized protein LOC111395145 [Olea europaea var. sylvestris]|uniref:uncharacterized protein LOC111395145 n=1 Tax=Olea europaea var. sylvestris TaxID=158386 RepID=UPI000C1D3924|nr:uncharacterized protein LOC111395145 [Olea europaea var. sylvestris]
MLLDHQLTPTTTPLYGFTGDSITPRGKMTLAVEMGESPQTMMNFMEFLVVDSRSAYHGVLGRPALKELGAVTSIHHLYMKFPTKNGVATVKGDQRGDAPAGQEDVDMIDAPPLQEVLIVDELDPRIMEHDPQASPIEELESFSADPRDLSKMLKIGRAYPTLIQNGFIREATYPKWVSNPVLVKKHNGKWRVCIDFTNLNRACPKDSFPLPRIDQLVDSTAGHELLSFMDAYSGYNQIPMHPADEEHTSFITDRGLYCYRIMPFGLKNAGATYQRLVNKIFTGLIGKTMEVYVDDMLVKSLEAENHIVHLNNTFQILRRYRMRLNPLKCAFAVASGKFLGQKEVQYLTGRVAALSRFVSKATNKCLPFFKVLKAGRKFQWTEECEEAFRGLKRHLGQAPLLSKLKPGDILQLYLAISNDAINSILIREEGPNQLPVYYTILQKPDASGRLLKWAVELSEFDLVFKARAAIKGQALADFVAEFANLPEVDEIMEPVEPPGAGVILISPEGHKLTSAVRFGFKATNNVAEYEALLAGLRLAKKMQISRIKNAHADVLSKLASSKDSELLVVVPIEHLLLPSTEAPNVMWVDGIPTWMQPIIAYLKDQVLPTEKNEAYKLRRRRVFPSSKEPGSGSLGPNWEVNCIMLDDFPSLCNIAMAQ